MDNSGIYLITSVLSGSNVVEQILVQGFRLAQPSRKAHGSGR